MLPDMPREKPKNPHASALGKKGGPARWANVSPEERSRLMREAVLKRWRKRKPGK
jgi:hypothetical protein